MTTAEELEEKGITVLDEFAWEDIDILRPGMDYKNGVTYVTMPMLLNVIKTVGKGKAARDVAAKEIGIGCITSERERFAYNEERVLDKGFGYPTTVIQPIERRWSLDSIQSFLKNESAPVDPVELFNEIRQVYVDYIEFTDENYYDMMTLFIMGSYMFRLFSSIGYVHFNGTKASGKSQNLNILAALAFNTIWSSSMSSPSLFRTMAGNPGVILLDEAEGFDGERGEELRRILNAGYIDGSTVQRTEKGPGDKFIVVNYEAYGPKAIASINPLDGVIGSRCVIVSMRPALRPIPQFNRNLPRWEGIRDRLYLWMMAVSPTMKDRIDQWEYVTRQERAPGLRARDWQITQEYVVLADYLDEIDGGKRCDALITFFTDYFKEFQKQQDASDRIRLLLRTLPRVLSTIHPHDGNWYPLKSIHETTSGYVEEDAREYYKTRTVSKHLDVLGFKTKRAHRTGQQIFITPEAVRQEFAQRRVDPFEEDVQWLAGDVEYDLSPAGEVTGPVKQSDDIWTSIADEEEWK